MKQKRSKELISKMAGMIISVLTLSLFLAACGGDVGEKPSEPSETSESNNIESYISTVKNGYLGEFTDITIGELLNRWYGAYYEEIGWDGGTTDDGEIIVEFQAQSEEYFEPVYIQFIMYDEQVFKLCAYVDGTGNTYEATEVADNLSFTYYNVKLLSVDSTDDEKLYEETLEMIEQFNGISGSAVLYGASADYNGDRSKLGEEFYEESPLEMTVTELLNYYHDNMFSYFVADMSNTTSDDVTLESILDSIPDSTFGSASVNIYGGYAQDNGYDATMQAEVGFYTDDDSEYVRIEAFSYDDGSRIIYFEGILTYIGENTFWAIDEISGIIFEVSFDQLGMLVQVLYSDYEESYILEGYYPKTSELNFDEVG